MSRPKDAFRRQYQDRRPEYTNPPSDVPTCITTLPPFMRQLKRKHDTGIFDLICLFLGTLSGSLSSLSASCRYPRSITDRMNRTSMVVRKTRGRDKHLIYELSPSRWAATTPRAKKALYNIMKGHRQAPYNDADQVILDRQSQMPTPLFDSRHAQCLFL